MTLIWSEITEFLLLNIFLIEQFTTQFHKDVNSIL